MNREGSRLFEIIRSLAHSPCWVAPCVLVLVGCNGASARPQQGNSTAEGCAGGPPVYCADSSRDLRPETPMPPPEAGRIFKDPDFGSRMIRVTDGRGVGGDLAGFSFGTDSSGEANEWGKFDPALGEHGGYRFYVGHSGGGVIPFALDAISMRITPLCKRLPRCELPAPATFSYVDPNVIYIQKTFSTVDAYNLSSGKQFTVYDFRKCPNIPGIVPGYKGAVTNSADDMKFSAYPGGKMQGYGTLVIFYDRAHDQCYWYDTTTGTTGGTGMETASIQVGVLAPPAAPQLRVAEGSLIPGDYYVQLTVSTRMNPVVGETKASPEAHIHLAAMGGIAVSPPAFDNPYKLLIAGYNVYIGDRPGQETLQAALRLIRAGYTQSSDLVKGSLPPQMNTAGWNVHNARLSRDGKVVRINYQQGNTIFFWRPGTTQVSFCTVRSDREGVASFCGGHQALGYTHMINADGEGTNRSLLLRSLSDLPRFTSLNSPTSIPLSGYIDSHWSWNSADPSDTMPLCGTFERDSGGIQGDGTLNASTNPVLAIRQPWDREVVCVATSGEPRVWRFAHHRGTGACNSRARDGSCWGNITIGNVSQDGKFYLFGSDWDWALGDAQGSQGCPWSGTCRHDAFIVELK